MIFGEKHVHFGLDGRITGTQKPNKYAAQQPGGREAGSLGDLAGLHLHRGYEVCYGIMWACKGCELDILSELVIQEGGTTEAQGSISLEHRIEETTEHRIEKNRIE